MAKYNTRATLAPHMATMKGWQDYAGREAVLSGLTKGASQGLSLAAGSSRANTFKNDIASQMRGMEDSLNSPGLDPMMRDSYKSELARLRMMGNQANAFNVDDMMKQYYGQYDKVSDPRQMANEIRKATIAANAQKESAKILAGSRIDAANIKELGEVNPYVTGSGEKKKRLPRGADSLIDPNSLYDEFMRSILDLNLT